MKTNKQSLEEMLETIKQFPIKPTPEVKQYSTWVSTCDHQFKRIEYGHNKEMFKCKCCGKTEWN